MIRRFAPAPIRRILPLFAVVLALFLPTASRAQDGSLLSAVPSTGLLSPGKATGDSAFGPGGVMAAPSQGTLAYPNAMSPGPAPLVPAGQAALMLSARFGKDMPPITGGLTWRVYAAKADDRGKFPAGQGRQVRRRRR